MKKGSTKYTPLYWCVKAISKLTNYLIKVENVFERLTNNEEAVQMIESDSSSENEDENN